MMSKVLFLVLFLFFFVFNAGFGFPFFSSKPSPIVNFSSADCSDYQRVQDKIFLDPVCVLNGRLPNFSLKDRADIVWTRILSFSKGYDSQTETILYRPAEIALSKADNLYPLTEKRRQQLVLAHQKGKKIWFPLSFFASLVVPDLAFYISEKDISQLKPCTKHNYLLAFETLDGKLIKAGSDFSFNRHLFGLRGYCQGNAGLDLKFYWGVCGAASQLFRASLTNPLLEIPKRWGHNDWYSAYYGKKVQGDDASVYETSKQLIITNNSTSDVVIKTFQQWAKTYLVLVTDKKSVQDKRVEIQKVYLGPLQVKLFREVYQKSLVSGKKVIKSLKSEFFFSKYLGINSESR